MRIRLVRSVLPLILLVAVSCGDSETGPEVDTVPPSDTADLRFVEATSSSVALRWTAPGDDGSTGTAAKYDLRYGLFPINDANWDSPGVHQVTGEPTPSPGGSQEETVVGGLDAATGYYFALRSADEAPNSSRVSNVAWATTLADPTWSLAYVADTENHDPGLRVVNVTNPASPAIVANFRTSGWVYDVAVSGSFAYITDDNSRLRVVDISNPASPATVGSVVMSGDGTDVEVSGSFAYATYAAGYYYGFQVVDVSNPASPALMGSLVMSDPDDVRGVAVSGSFAYLAGHYSMGLRVVNISNPASLAIVGSVAMPNSAFGVAVSGSFAYVVGYSGLQVVDVSNPASPAIVGSVDTPDNGIDVAVSGSFVYVADSDSGLQVVDVSNPTSPVIVGSVDTGRASGVAVSGR